MESVYVRIVDGETGGGGGTRTIDPATIMSYLCKFLLIGALVMLYYVIVFTLAYPGFAADEKNGRAPGCSGTWGTPMGLHCTSEDYPCHVRAFHCGLVQT